MTERGCQQKDRTLADGYRWAVLAAPLLISTDLTTLKPASLAVLLNKQVRSRLGREQRGQRLPLLALLPPLLRLPAPHVSGCLFLLCFCSLHPASPPRPLPAVPTRCADSPHPARRST